MNQPAFRPSKIISGGQTGVDRAALDVALALGIPHGGWVPLGRRAEDGPIPRRYQLQEIDAPDYDCRTQRNVEESDATCILSCRPPTSGSALTLALARRHGKPVIHIDCSAAPAEAAERLRRWLQEIRPAVLNVAGPRESTEPGIYERANRVLRLALTTASSRASG